MSGVSTLTFVDYSRENASMQINHITPTAAGLAALQTQLGTLRSAIDGIARGTLVTETLSAITRYASSVSGGTDEEAQREEKWLVVYEDITPVFGTAPDEIENLNYLKVFSVEIPCADLSLRTGFSDEVYRKNGSTVRTDSPAFTTFATAFEAVAKSPSGGSVTVRSIRAVGRNT